MVGDLVVSLSLEGGLLLETLEQELQKGAVRQVRNQHPTVAEVRERQQSAVGSPQKMTQALNLEETDEAVRPQGDQGVRKHLPDQELVVLLVITEDEEWTGLDKQTSEFDPLTYNVVCEI